MHRRKNAQTKICKNGFFCTKKCTDENMAGRKNIQTKKCGTKKIRNEKTRDEKMRDEKLRDENLLTKKCPTKNRHTKIGLDTVTKYADAERLSNSQRTVNSERRNFPVPHNNYDLYLYSKRVLNDPNIFSRSRCSRSRKKYVR